MKLLLETAGTMDWKIIGVFDSVEEIDNWIEEKWETTYEKFKKYMEEEMEDEEYTPSREDWYDELEIRVREIPEIKK